MEEEEEGLTIEEEAVEEGSNSAIISRLSISAINGTIDNSVWHLSLFPISISAKKWHLSTFSR